ncbi:hypothetical protein ACFE04_004428 [Oxalis oulophora]
MEIQVIPSMEVQVVNEEQAILSTKIQVISSTEIQVVPSTETQESSSTKNIPEYLSSSIDLAIILLIVGNQFDKEIYVIRAATVNDIIHIATEKALLSSITEVIHDDEEAYSSSTYDDFLEEPSSIDIESSSFIGFTTSSSSIDSVLTLMDVSSDTLNVPSSLAILVSSQTIRQRRTLRASFLKHLFLCRNSPLLAQLL